LVRVNEPFVPAPTSVDLDAASADAAATPHPGPADDGSIDLDAIERDLTDVQSALERLNDGSYWADEVTGAPIPDEVLATFPLTRSVAGNRSGAPSGNAVPNAAD
jgi:hypothetical protein